MLYDSIPSLDLAHFTDGTAEQKEQFVRELGNAYQNIGFVAIKNHGLSDALTKQLYQAVESFFALDDATKSKYSRPDLSFQRGYTGKGQEHAKGRNVGDLKEFFQIGQEVDPNDPVLSQYPPNVWPSELPELQKLGVEAYKTLEKAGLAMLRAIALYLGLEEDYFDRRASKGNSIIRTIHYFPISDPDSVPDDAVRAAEHGDINLITLLMGASAEGLQVLRRDGQWIPITALPNQIVVNVGDMLDRLTNHKLKSTIHRVVNPPKDKMNTSRYSIPFFMHPRSEMDLTCLESCIDAENPKRYSDATAGEFLEERLREIGLLK